jgi:hypothetical protein
VCKLSNFAQTVAPSLVTLQFDMEAADGRWCFIVRAAPPITAAGEDLE